VVVYSRETARRSLLNTASYRAVSQVATLVGYLVLVRTLPERSFGIYSLLYSFIPVVSTAASLGIELTLKRFQPEFLRSGNVAAASWLLRVAMYLRLGSNALLLAVILLAWNWIAPVFKLEDYRADFLLFSLLILLYFQERLLELALAAHMLHRFSVGSTVLIAVAKLVAYVVLAVLHAMTLKTAILADTLAFGLAYVFMRVAYNRKALPRQESGTYRPAPSDRQRMLRYALFSNFNDASSLLLYSQTDNFFVAAILNPIAVGAYSFYTRLNAMAANVTPIRLFENVLQPVFFAIPPDKARERIPQYFTLLLNCGLVVQLPIIAYTIVYHQEIVALLLGNKFRDVSWMLPLVIAFGTTSNVVAIPVTSVAQYYERTSLILFSQLFGLYQILAMLLLVRAWGLGGAAIASGTYHLFRNLFVWWRVRRDARWLNFPGVLAYSALIWGAAIGGCFGVKAALKGLPMMNLACGLAICALATLVYIRSPALCASDRELLARLFHGKERRLLQRLGLIRPEQASNS
jgi:O-antigen/teichoic acid export membrane protein